MFNSYVTNYQRVDIPPDLRTWIYHSWLRSTPDTVSCYTAILYRKNNNNAILTLVWGEFQMFQHRGMTWGCMETRGRDPKLVILL